ncbi:MAG: hypothetical protein HUU10_00725 [Bacteroidetes bacterium]|nr:hypothetical protein [Bacteroidota bacterium]
MGFPWSLVFRLLKSAGKEWIRSDFSNGNGSTTGPGADPALVDLVKTTRTHQEAISRLTDDVKTLNQQVQLLIKLVQWLIILIATALLIAIIWLFTN